MRTVGTIGIPPRHPPVGATTGGWRAASQPSPRVLARELAAHPRVRAAGVLSGWLVLIAASWAAVAGLVWLVLYALGSA